MRILERAPFSRNLRFTRAIRDALATTLFAAMIIAFVVFMVASVLLIGRPSDTVVYTLLVSGFSILVSGFALMGVE